MERGVKTVVLKCNVSEEEATVMIAKKRTVPFKSLFSRPKKKEIQIHSVSLFYECILTVSGSYAANYYRKSKHSVSVPDNVREVVLGESVFGIRTKSKTERAFIVEHKKNKIDIELEEHVFIEGAGRLAFDHHGRRIDFPYSTDSKLTENYPTHILKRYEPSIKGNKTNPDDAIEGLKRMLKKPIETDVRDLEEEFVLHDMLEIYVPIFEARVIGPKQKVAVMRVDAARKKML